MNGYKPGAPHSVQNGQYYPPEARPQGEWSQRAAGNAGIANRGMRG